MKRMINFLMGGVIVLGAQLVQAQSVDESRMNRDIEIAENILSTLIKQELDKRNFFPVEIRGSYRAGYGVTFTIPTSMLLPMKVGNGENVYILDGTPGVYSYSFSNSNEPCNTCDDEELAVLEREKAEGQKVKVEKEKVKADKE